VKQAFGTVDQQSTFSSQVDEGFEEMALIQFVMMQRVQRWTSTAREVRPAQTNDTTQHVNAE
jgi:hypothetical protein